MNVPKPALETHLKPVPIFAIAKATSPTFQYGKAFPNWSSLICVFCAAMLALPMAAWLPFNLMQQSRAACEEELRTGEDTDSEATEERKRRAAIPDVPVLPVIRLVSSRLPSLAQTPDGRGEFRFVNGTGAMLRC